MSEIYDPTGPYMGLRTNIRLGGCDCVPRHHFCGHCLTAGRGSIAILEDYPWCRNCGPLTAKDVITMYPEGHNCGYNTQR